ncbi:hypothetical protein ACFTWD_12125 [Streptomyces sp. NPDC056943]|uniref:hypothetical protein n=1 Tax=Streptomyces sp. NPDC056943 TaxID=3345971 RepID=UPI003645F067
MVKARDAWQHDLVARLDGPADLRRLAAEYSAGVIVQRHVPNSRVDRKIWVVGGHIYTAVRDSPLTALRDSPLIALPDSPLAAVRDSPRAAVRDSPPAAPGRRGAPERPARPHASWLRLARRVGAVFELDVYGIDLVIPPTRRPVIVDVNAFPGGVHRRAGAARTLAALALDLISRGPPA